jgi:WD40 repeat protein
MFEFREVTAPYPGLRPFEPYESEIFFGRKGHTNRLLEILQRERFLAVIGPSGCGKSSLVRAGMLPGLASGALGTGSDWRLALLRPGAQPMLALAQALLGRYALGPELVGEARLPKDADEVTADAALAAAELRRGAEGLASLMQTAASRLPEGSAPFDLLVLVDQFEEIFTYASALGAEADESEDFVKLLLASRADVASRIYVVLTMRTDFLGNCVRFLDLPEAINRAQYLTPRLNREEMERAIVGPARVFGGDVDPDLVPGLIASISHDSDQLPILQHALARMWRAAEEENHDSPLIDTDCTDAVGGVAEALNRHADEVFTSLTPEQQALTEILFRAITERRESAGQDVRRPQTLAAIAEWANVIVEDLKPVIATFAAPDVSFLHYGRELVNKSVIDLTHEALIRQWARLRDWVANEHQRGQGYRRWSQRAVDYQEGTSNLLTGGDLARALEWWDPGVEQSGWQPSTHWARRYSVLQGNEAVDEFEWTRQFLIASRDEEQRRREEAQRRLEEQAKAERQRADRERQLAEEARASAERAQFAEHERTKSLFESQLTHASLLARVQDYAEARRVLAESTSLDQNIAKARQHSRNLLAGYVEIMGGSAAKVYEGANAGLVGGVAVSPDGKLLAAAGERATLVLFDAASGKLLRRLEGHGPGASSTSDVNSVVFDPQGRRLYSGGEDGRIIRWSLPTGDKLGEWKAPGAVRALALSPDGEKLASGDADGRIALWLVADGKRILTLKRHTQAIGFPLGLQFSSDGKLLASASSDKTARLWDVKSGRSLKTLKGHTSQVIGVAFSPDGKMLATASDDKSVIIWETETGQLLRQLHGHQNIVFAVAFSDDSGQLLSASRDNTLRLWDVASGITRRIYQGHEAGLWSVALHGERIYTASDDATVRRWTLATPEQWLWETGGSLQAAAISPDGRILVLGMQSGILRLYRLPDGQILAERADAHGSEDVNRIAFNKDGSVVATAGMDNKVMLWQVEATGDRLTLLHTLEGHDKAVHAVAFSPDGRTLATAGYDGQIGLFDATSGKERLFPAHEGIVASVAFSPQGDRLLSAGINDFRLRYWDLGNPGGPPQEIAQAQDQLLWASLSPDGREAAAVGREQTVALYDLAKPSTPPHRLVGHESTVYRAIYSPDGRQLTTVSADMTVRLWDLDSQRLLFTVRLPTEMQYPSPLWDFDFRCTAAGDCWIAVPLTVGRLALYRLPCDHPPDAIRAAPAKPGSE